LAIFPIATLGMGHMNLELLISQIRNLEASAVALQVEERLREFKLLHSKGNEKWFSELCFCILTANSTARLAIRIQQEIGAEGFLTLPEEEIARTLERLGHRFSERRAQYIVQAREFSHIKNLVVGIGNEGQARQWLVENVMGLGYKEASHFLRNVGYDNLAILDRHILRIMREYDMVQEIPKGLTRRRYVNLEARLQGLATRLNMPLSRLDLYLWYMKTGAVLK